MSSTFPFHYRDDRAETPCESSYTEGWVEGRTCPRGCDGSRTHYANDGHPECEEQTSDFLPPMPPDFGGDDESVSDDDLRAFLKTRGLDPIAEPYPCSLAVAEEYKLPIAEAHVMVSGLR